MLWFTGGEESHASGCAARGPVLSSETKSPGVVKRGELGPDLIDKSIGHCCLAGTLDFLKASLLPSEVGEAKWQ